MSWDKLCLGKEGKMLMKCCETVYNTTMIVLDKLNCLLAAKAGSNDPAPPAHEIYFEREKQVDHSDKIAAVAVVGVTASVITLYICLAHGKKIIQPVRKLVSAACNWWRGDEPNGQEEDQPLQPFNGEVEEGSTMPLHSLVLAESSQLTPLPDLPPSYASLGRDGTIPPTYEEAVNSLGLAAAQVKGYA